jgi:hypothetical protein
MTEPHIFPKNQCEVRVLIGKPCTELAAAEFYCTFTFYDPAAKDHAVPNIEQEINRMLDRLFGPASNVVLN